MQALKRSDWFTLLLCTVILSCTLSYPFNNDNALYAYMADLALKGHLPYVGSWDQNYPAIVVVHAVQIVLSGHSQLAFHIFDVVLQLLGSWLLIRVGERLLGGSAGRWAGRLAAVLASLYYVQQGLWMAGERDTYVSILMLWAVYLAIGPAAERSSRAAAATGVLSGLCFLFRPTYGLYGVVFLLWWGMRRTEDRWKLAGWCLAGAALPVILTVLLYAVTGGLKDLWQATMLFNLRIYSGAGIAFSLWEPVRFYALTALLGVAGLVVVWERSRQNAFLWLGLFASSVISLIVLYRHSVYHYHPAMTLLILLSAVGWVWLAERVRPLWRFAPVLVTAVVVIYFATVTLRGNTIKQVLEGIAAGRITSLPESYNYYEGSPAFGTLVQEEVGDYLEAHTTRGEAVQMFGPYSYPQYRAGLGTASRFQTLHAITMRGSGDTLQPFQRDWRREYLNDMQQVRPKYFIVCDAPEAFRQYYGGRLGHEILREDFTELGNWLFEHYTPETKIGAFTLYRLRPLYSIKP